MGGFWHTPSLGNVTLAPGRTQWDQVGPPGGVDTTGWHTGVMTEDTREPGGSWWYNHKTGRVEFGRQSLGGDRDGPYSSEADALRAPEIARQRAKEWEEEEAD